MSRAGTSKHQSKPKLKKISSKPLSTEKKTLSQVEPMNGERRPKAIDVAGGLLVGFHPTWGGPLGELREAQRPKNWKPGSQGSIRSCNQALIENATAGHV